MENYSMNKRKIHNVYDNSSSEREYSDDEIMTVFVNGFSKDEFELNRHEIISVLEKDFGSVYKFLIKEPIFFGRAYMQVIFKNIKAIDNICYHNDARVEQCANYSNAIDSNDIKKLVKIPIYLASLRRKLHITVSYKSLIAFEERSKQHYNNEFNPEFVNPATMTNAPWLNISQLTQINQVISSCMNDLLVENKNIMSLINEKSVSEQKIRDIHESFLNTMQDKLKSILKRHEKKTEHMYKNTKEMYKKMKVMHDAIMHGEFKEEGEVSSDNSD